VGRRVTALTATSGAGDAGVGAGAGGIGAGAGGIGAGAGARLAARARLLGAAVTARLLARGRSLAYERELPAVLESVAAQLRAGASLRQAVVGVVPPRSRSALPEHWRRLADDVAVVSVEAALGRWAEEAGDRSSVRLAAGALALAATTGGSPARAVDGVASTLRARLALGEEVRALSAQARASAAVIAAAPVAFSVLAGLGDRRIFAFFASPLGLVLLVAGLGLDALGAWWMHRLCRVPT
jgi:tight adherence protein B